MYMFYFFFSNDKYIINKKRGYKTNVSYISGTPMKYQNRPSRIKSDRPIKIQNAAAWAKSLWEFGRMRT
jgi:hypothetical protein